VERAEKIIGESRLVAIVDPLHPETLSTPVNDMESPGLGEIRVRILLG
jgi:hypothetical protein